MVNFPTSLEDAIAQAKQATVTALEAGCTRLQVELVIPEIALQAQAIAKDFTTLFADYGPGLKVIFPDTGAAALARRDWGDVAFQVTDLGSRNTPIETKVTPEDRLFLLVCPSAVEVQKVETLCNLAGDRPVILLIPQLESVATVGIGYAARQLRDRFLSTLETCYYLQPLEGAAILRRYPSLWQVWLQKEDAFELYTEEPQKPVGDHLERLLAKAFGVESEQPQPGVATTGTSKRSGLLSSLQRFIKALSQ